MGEPVRKQPGDPAVHSEASEDRAAAIVALAAAAFSGFVVGLLVHGGLALSLLVFALLVLAGVAGWVLRGVL